VYCEKPLTRTVWEARMMAQAAEKYKVATQMGNQGYSTDAIRVACEIVWAGEIGDVTEVHAWHGGPGWPQGMQKIPAPTAVPDTLDWDLWLGTAASRPYTAGDEDYRAYAASGVGQGRGPAPAGGPGGGGGRGGGRGGGQQQPFGFYLPFNWRGFHDFGSGLFGDWGVHIMGAAYWALNLRPEYLISVERIKAEGLSPFTYPVKNGVKYEFGARGSMPPCTLYWEDCVNDGGWVPPGMTAEEARKIPGQGPQVAAAGRGGFGPGGPGGAGVPGGPPAGGPPGGGGGGGRGGPQLGTGYNCILKGTKGYLGTSGQTGDVGLLPGSRWAEYKLPNPYLTRSPGAGAAAGFTIHSVHLRDWVRACKGGAPACSNFSVAAPYTEWLVLGAVATHYEGKLLWDNARMEITNNKDATKWIKPTYRKGWEVKV
jgi:hypothetical protein